MEVLWYAARPTLLLTNGSLWYAKNIGGFSWNSHRFKSCWVGNQIKSYMEELFMSLLFNTNLRPD
jgi:hypothetical protein